MQHVISVENMRDSDRAAIENGVPSLELMARAAHGLFVSTPWKSKNLIVVGSGNNGGDGYALACELAQSGTACSIVSLSEKTSEDSSHYRATAQKFNVPVLSFDEGKSLFDDAEIIVDCIFGTGFSGNVSGIHKEAIDRINRSNAFVLSADINSGMNGDTGLATLAVVSDLTVSIGQYKNGFFINGARRMMRRLINAEIGIHPVRKENYLLTGTEFEQKLEEIQKRGFRIDTVNLEGQIRGIDDLKLLLHDPDGYGILETDDTVFLVSGEAVYIKQS